MRLTGHQRQELSEALRDAFTPQRLTEMLRFRLEKNLADISLGSDYQEIVFALIAAAEAEGWTQRLLAAAREANPGNARLQLFAQHFGLVSDSSSHQDLERIIRRTNSFFDIEAWRRRLGELEGQVCRVETSTSFGTGFLVADDIVITNYHVVEDVLNGRGASPSDIALRFDYKRMAEGMVVNNGAVHRLASDWLVAKSENSPDGALPRTDQLDYVLLRIADMPGAHPIGLNPEPSAPPRGFIEVPETEFGFERGAPLFILQHPSGDPLKLAIDTEAVIGVNSNRTRVTYRTNTLAGSSGSPCFNQHWQLVALHHSGDPLFHRTGQHRCNEGIPVSAIREHLATIGLSDVFGRSR